MLKFIIPAAALTFAAIGGANAHVTLETQQAKVGSTYKAIFRVGHGCEGAPTLTLRVQIPEGYINVKPMPKAGWTLEVVKGAYAKTYDYHGSPMAEGVKEVVWSGGSLLDEHYDEFVVRGTLAGDFAPDSMVYFPVVQECADAAERWIEIPEAGKGADDYEFPAPGMKILPKE